MTIWIYLTDCDSLIEPANGVLSTTDVTSGTSVEITCNTGYSLSGISPITCTNGVWSGPVPSCPAGKCIKRYVL